MSEENAPRGAGGGTPSSLPRENLYRINPEITLTRSEGAAMPTLTGHFAVWNQWTEIRSAYEGNFMERFAPSSMTKTLSESTPKVLFQHGRDPQVGDKVLGKVARVAPDAEGASYEVPLFDTSYNRDLLPGLEAGEYGASFRFSVVREDVNPKPARSEFNPRGIPERTVTEARVMEFGPVTFPAYAGATAGIRSITDEFVAERLMANEDLYEWLLNKIAESARFSVSFNGLGQPVTTASNTANVFATELLGVGEWPEQREEISDPDGDQNDRADQPEPPEATTEPEPEPSEATTRSDPNDLFWFTKNPKK